MEKTTNICLVIMAGGAGTRLWPLSRAMHPKQFLKLKHENTMLQETIERCSDINIASSITICNEEHRFIVAEQLKQIGKLDSIILEPEGRNTAPAIALAAFTVPKETLILVLAADHVIEDKKAFTEAVNKAIPIAEKDKFVAFGVNPTEVNTGYGYIQRGKKYENYAKVDAFVEKPSSKKALEYIDSGDYVWNSGMYLFKADKYLKELKRFERNIYDACKESISEIKPDLDFIRINNTKFKTCPDKSIDYAVMERTKDAFVVDLEAGWSDIGSWSSLWNVSDKDKNGNVVKGDVISYDTEGSYISTQGSLVTTLGVSNLVIVVTVDAVMVANKDHVHDIKVITKELKIRSRPELESNREVYRPWGKYDSIDKGDRYQVKRITVNPGAKLSVQMHHHRAEHWVVVSGVAKVTKGDDVFLLSENESIFIPVGTKHALENLENVPLKLIEVQSGVYLGEDDIVRFEDSYGRIS